MIPKRRIDRPLSGIYHSDQTDFQSPAPMATRFPKPSKQIEVAGTRDDLLADPDNLTSLNELVVLIRSQIRLLEAPLSYSQLRVHPIATSLLRPLTRTLADSRHPGVLFTLLSVSRAFKEISVDDSLDRSRALAAEIVAIRIVRGMAANDLAKALTLDFRIEDETVPGAGDAEDFDSEERPLLGTELFSSLSDDAEAQSNYSDITNGKLFSCLEVAIMGKAKYFLDCPNIQEILGEIWRGDIQFFSSIDLEGYRAKKEISYYRKERNFWSGYARLRVPRYRFVFQEINFAILLALFLALLFRRDERFSVLELVLDIWFAGFALDELNQWQDAGNLGLYSANPVRSFFDVGMIVVFAAWLLFRVSETLFDHAVVPGLTAFDLLSLEALFLVPRVFSTLGLFPYYGTLLPALREMVKDFMRFSVLTIVVFAGFLITFYSLGRESYTFESLTWLIVRIFFGSTYLGFDAMSDINPILGPLLMIIFVVLTNILLITILISILGNSFQQNNNKEQFSFVFAVACVESMTSDHLAVFFPPLNLIPLLLLRPLRLFLPSRHKWLRKAKFWLLRVTHLPYVLGVTVFERLCVGWHSKSSNSKPQGFLKPPLPNMGALIADPAQKKPSNRMGTTFTLDLDHDHNHAHNYLEQHTDPEDQAEEQDRLDVERLGTVTCSCEGHIQVLTEEVKALKEMLKDFINEKKSDL